MRAAAMHRRSTATVAAVATVAIAAVAALPVLTASACGGDGGAREGGGTGGVQADGASGGDAARGDATAGDATAGDATAGDATAGDAIGGETGDATESARELSIAFERIKPGVAFDVIATATQAGAGIAGLAIVVTSDRGAVGAVSDEGSGVYRARVTPDPGAGATGEHAVTVTSPAWGISVRRTAVVLASVGPRWGQPQAYAGLVNTPGWEDSTCLSPDGEWLLLEYLPVSISCALEGMKPTLASCAKARGPWTAPERPDMPGASRIAPDGAITQGCPSLGFVDPPFATPPQSIYGFHRRRDGSFADPFVVRVDGADGCLSAFGPALLAPVNGKARLLFAFDDPRDADANDTRADLFTTELSLGTPTALAAFSGAASLQMNAVRLGIPPAPHQGNPAFWLDASGDVAGVLYDDETLPAAEQVLWAQPLSGSFPAGPWGPAAKLPPPLGAPGKKNYQPFLDRNEALWSQDQNIVSSRRVAGASLGDPAAWGSLVVELSPGSGSLGPAGSLVVVGEPTKAVRDGKEILSFVYAQVAADGTLDLNAAFVEAQP